MLQDALHLQPEEGEMLQDALHLQPEEGEMLQDALHLQPEEGRCYRTLYIYNLRRGDVTGRFTFTT